ncbi:MAG: DUF2442 domain-containing protein [Chloroflexi bacterium]|nr:DUF2442 domain-containing protein [Chloroflexota bacterium]
MHTLTSNLIEEHEEQVAATGVRFDGRKLIVALSDGREIALPLDKFAWLSWLTNATPAQQANWSLEPDGYAVYWEELDDGFEVEHILTPQLLR